MFIAYYYYEKTNSYKIFKSKYVSLETYYLFATIPSLPWNHIYIRATFEIIPVNRGAKISKVALMYIWFQGKLGIVANIIYNSRLTYLIFKILYEFIFS